MAAPILNLDRLTDRTTVVIDDKPFWLIPVDQLPPAHSVVMIRTATRLQALIEKAEKEDLDASEMDELRIIPDRMCRIVLKAPDDVHAALDDERRMLIIDAAKTPSFLRARSTPPASAAETAASPSTGESGSPA